MGLPDGAEETRHCVLVSGGKFVAASGDEERVGGGGDAGLRKAARLYIMTQHRVAQHPAPGHVTYADVRASAYSLGSQSHRFTQPAPYPREFSFRLCNGPVIAQDGSYAGRHRAPSRSAPMMDAGHGEQWRLTPLSMLPEPPLHAALSLVLSVEAPRNPILITHYTR